MNHLLHAERVLDPDRKVREKALKPTITALEKRITMLASGKIKTFSMV